MAWPRRPSLTMLVLALFTVYVAHTVRTLYHVVHTEPCLSGSRCYVSYLQAKPSLQLSIFTSLQARNVEIDKLNLVLTIEDFDPHADIIKELKVPLPRGMRPRGSLYAHTFVHAPGLEPWHDERAQHAVASLTTLMVPKSEEVNLVARNKNDKPGPKKLMAHWRSHLSLNLMTDNFLFDLKALPGDVLPYFKISPVDRNLYLPMLFVDQLSNRVKDLILVNDSTVTLPLRLSYTPISLSKLRLWVHMQQALHTLQDLGFSEKDGDEVKGIFADTNLYFLGLTFLVATFHLLFDFLAFKNDISFWKAKRDMVGMSIRAVSWRCFSTFVLFLFLLDEQTSLLVLIPAGVGSIIEAWKVTKAFKIQIRWTGKLPRIQVGTSSVNERQTEQFDSEAMKYLSYALYPLCLGSAMYSLLYVQHKSWYSWVINSLVNGIYAFGFLFMLPQLFVNYRLKSVAHLPWKAFMYKAFNTFIDDVFAFIITMPTSHRLACFRDDVVFLIYLYQRWLFPVDKSRMNEYGASYEDEPQKRSNKAKNKVS